MREGCYSNGSISCTKEATLSTKNLEEKVLEGIYRRLEERIKDLDYYANEIFNSVYKLNHFVFTPEQEPIKNDGDFIGAFETSINKLFEIKEKYAQIDAVLKQLI